MNYLQLAQRLREKVGGAGEGPVSVINQRGEYSRYVNWINEAWVELQNFRPDWSWMHKTLVGQLNAGVQSYDDLFFGINNFGQWDKRDIKLFNLTTADEKRLVFVDYDIFKQRYSVGLNILGRPTSVSVDRSNKLVFGNTPDKAYTITADYYERAVGMVVNTDIPLLPEQFHMLIVYKAMEYAGRFENAGEVAQDGAVQYLQMLERLEEHELPPMIQARPLA